MSRPPSLEATSDLLKIRVRSKFFFDASVIEED